jgi:hypothetical protein
LELLNYRHCGMVSPLSVGFRNRLPDSEKPREALFGGGRRTLDTRVIIIFMLEGSAYEELSLLIGRNRDLREMGRDLIQQNHDFREALRETLLDVYSVRKRIKRPRIKRPTPATATSRCKGIRVIRGFWSRG